jgi:hypothetical protein
MTPVGSGGDENMDVLQGLTRLGFEEVGAIRPLNGGLTCRPEMDRDVQGFVVYAHVVGDAIKKFGTTRAPLRSRVGQNASTTNQVIAIQTPCSGGDPRESSHRDLGSPVHRDRLPEVLERELNARFDTMRDGWAIRLG